ncbi:hypothetical protein [Pontiella sulfatireligans]|nr:hypothetical protein [Pontiella sulfatireligans]
MVSANAFLIDDFSDPANQTTTSQGNQTAWEDTTSSVIGGIRDGSVGCESSSSGGTTTAKFANGKLEVYTNKKASPSIYLAYDGTAGWGSNLDTDPFGNGTISPVLDFTDGGGNDRFSITFASAGGMDPSTNFFNDVLLSVKIEGEKNLYQANMDDAANAWMDENYNALAAGRAAAFEIDFSALGASIDMTKVEAFSLHICSENKNMDYSIDKIEAVPEPAVLTLVALFGIGLLSAKRLFNR